MSHDWLALLPVSAVVFCAALCSSFASQAQRGRKRSAVLGGLLALSALTIALSRTRIDSALFAAHAAGALTVLALLAWVQRSARRSRWLQAGLVVALVQTLVASMFIGQVFPSAAISSGLSALAAFAVVTGLAPYVERRFRWNTRAHWADLSQPYGSPLVAELQAKAPAVFELSRSAAEIAVAAGKAVGADALKIRAAAMHADVGRLETARNSGLASAARTPSLELSPELECLVEFDHVKDSVATCRDYDMPPFLAQLVSEHHGTMVIRKALEDARERRGAEAHELSLEPFRYPGPRPSTRESAAVQAGWFLVENGASSAALEELGTAVSAGEWADSGLSAEESRRLLDAAGRSASALHEATGSTSRGAW